MILRWKSLQALLLTTAGLLLAMLSGVASAEVPLPKIPPAVADYSSTQQCVRPIEDMRKNHMKYLLHHRDQTVHEGIRTQQFDLTQCVNCHATRGADGKAVRIDSPGQFCFNCHKYAGVRIDCFQCHSDLPSTKDVHFHKIASDAMPPHHMQFNDKAHLTPTTFQVIDGKGAQK